MGPQLLGTGRYFRHWCFCEGGSNTRMKIRSLKSLSYFTRLNLTSVSVYTSEMKNSKALAIRVHSHGSDPFFLFVFRIKKQEKTKKMGFFYI